MDVEAINYDSKANVPAPCTYTKVIFYAGSNRVGGNAALVEKIEVSTIVVSNEELIGTLTNLVEESPAPDGCNPAPISLTYQFTSPTNVGGTNIPMRFTTRYFYEDGTSEAGSLYEFSTSSTTECIVQNLTL